MKHVRHRSVGLFAHLAAENPLRRHKIQPPQRAVSLCPGFLSFLGFLALLLCNLLCFSPAAQAKVFSPQSYTLPNGLQVILVENHRAPILSAMLWYRVGGADDPVGQTGLAHFLEHMMFKGTQNLKEGEHSRLLARVGATENAFTGPDYTAYFATLASANLPLFLRLESERMHHLILDEKSTEIEKSVIREERRQTTENEPSAKLVEGLNALLYLNHPYGRPNIGWDSEIKAVTTAQLKKFYKKYYKPQNALLILSGAVKAESALPLIAHYFNAASTTTKTTKKTNPIKRPVLRERTQRQDLSGAVKLELSDKRIEQPQWLRLYAAPSYRTAKKSAADNDFNIAAANPYALEVLAEILGHSELGRFYSVLGRQQALVAGASVSYNPERFDDASFAISLSPRPDITPAAVEKAAEELLAEIAEKGVSTEEVNAAKKRLERSALFARDSLMTSGYSFGLAFAGGQSAADVEAWPERIGRVTSKEINAAARIILQQKGHVSGWLLPEPPMTPEKDKAS